MARPTLMTHRKFRRLCRLLGRPKYHCRGILEMIWDSANESGEPVLGDSIDVELTAEWDGDEGELATALNDAGFIDHLGVNFEIHNYWHHCPAYVRKRRQREMERRIKGDRLVTDSSLTAERLKTAPNGSTPSPSPSPSPSLEEPESTAAADGGEHEGGQDGVPSDLGAPAAGSDRHVGGDPKGGDRAASVLRDPLVPGAGGSGEGGGHGAAGDVGNNDVRVAPPSDPGGGSGGNGKPSRADAFAEWWPHYPKKVGRKKAEAAWCRLKDPPSAAEVIAFLGLARQTNRWAEKSRIPDGPTFVNGARWEDDLDGYTWNELKGSAAARPGRQEESEQERLDRELTNEY